MIIDDVVPCEDGHTQECTLLASLLESTQPVMVQPDLEDAKVRVSE
jgi:hypothetical protein